MLDNTAEVSGGFDDKDSCRTEKEVEDPVRSVGGERFFGWEDGGVDGGLYSGA